MTTAYWTGTREAHLEASQISASWGRGDWCGDRIRFANDIFHFWYVARQSINACTNSAHRQSMTIELESAGTAGAGFGIDDLNEAFEHMDHHGGRWTEDAGSYSYFGGPNKVFRSGGIINNLPKPFKTFADAVDGKFQKVRNAIRHFDEATQTIDRQLATRLPDWDQIATALGQIKEWGEQAEPFLWARPRAAAVVSTTVAFADALGNIHSGATAYVQARQAHFPRGAAAAIGLLRTAVGFVPVLGTYYGGMVDLIPTLHNWYTSLIQQRVARIDRACSGRP